MQTHIFNINKQKIITHMNHGRAGIDVERVGGLWFGSMWSNHKYYRWPGNLMVMYVFFDVNYAET